MNTIIIASVLVTMAVAKPQYFCNDVGQECGGIPTIPCCPGSECVKDSSAAWKLGTCFPTWMKGQKSNIKVEKPENATPEKYCSQMGSSCDGLAALPCCHGVCLRDESSPLGTCSPWLAAASKSVQKDKKYGKGGHHACSRAGGDCGGLYRLHCCQGATCRKESNDAFAWGTCVAEVGAQTGSRAGSLVEPRKCGLRGDACDSNADCCHDRFFCRKVGSQPGRCEYWL